MFYQELRSPSHILQQLSAALRKQAEPPVATALCFVYFEHLSDVNGRPTRRFLKASSAAHPSLIIVRKDDTVHPEVEYLPKRDSGATTGLLNLPLAVFGEECIEVFPGDLIVGFTDGIEEARPPDEAVGFGRNGVLSTVLQHRNEQPECIARAIFSMAKEFANDVLNDDTTIVVARIRDTMQGTNATN